jgi:Raf kinase inhibitor-like YbhB/YbcL family protein
MNPNQRKISSKMRQEMAVALAITLLVGLPAFLAFSKRQSEIAHGEPGGALVLSSSSFVSEETIPRRYTCDGANVSPELHWTHAPAESKSFALVMHDPDAPVDFTHWLAYNIPPSVRELAEGASPGGSMPAGSQEGANSFGRSGYGGPCPPAGRPHHYRFQLYALDIRVDLPAGAERGRLESAMQGHLIAEGQITGIYGR